MAEIRFRVAVILTIVWYAVLAVNGCIIDSDSSPSKLPDIYRFNVPPVLLEDFKQFASDNKYIHISESPLEYGVFTPFQPNTFPNVSATLLVPSTDPGSILKYLQQKSQLSHIQKRQTAVTPKEFFSKFVNYEGIVAFLDSVSEMVRVDFGKSYLNKTMYAYKFGNGNKNVVFIGGQHAREWISVSTVLYIAHQIATNATYKPLLGEYTFTVVPVANPDGYDFTFTSNATEIRLWRKNMQPNSGSKNCIGIDMNRNWPSYWNSPGSDVANNSYILSSSLPCSGAYQGSKAMESPEVLNLVNYIRKISNLFGFIDYHSFSKFILTPWSHTCVDNKDAKQLQSLADNIKSAIETVGSKDWTAGQTCRTIYPAVGTSTDFTYGDLNVLNSIAIELRPDQNSGIATSGFELPPSEIIPSGEESLAGFLAFLKFNASGSNAKSASNGVARAMKWTIFLSICLSMVVFMLCD